MLAETLTLVLPLPPRSQHQNWRGHWAARAKQTKKCRNLAADRTYEARCEGWQRASVEFRFFHKDSRRRDAVNFMAACKAYVDGVVEAGLLPDDDSEHLEIGKVSFFVDKRSPRLELFFTRLE